MRYKNIFSGVIVTVKAIRGGIVHYTRSHPLDWRYNLKGNKIMRDGELDHMKPEHYFNKCYRKID